MNPAEHYERYGAFEKDVEGHYINPSNAFDANAYYRAKLGQVRRLGEEVAGKTGEGITAEDIVRIFADSGISPIAHIWSRPVVKKE